MTPPPSGSTPEPTRESALHAPARPIESGGVPIDHTIPQFGAGSSGDGSDAIAVSTVVGLRNGPAGTAWASSLATPSVGHSPFVVVAKPNLPVVPFTLLVPAVDVASRRHAELTMGAAHAGLARAILDLGMDDVDGELCVIASVWIGADATDERLVFANTRDAAVASLTVGAAGGPWHGNLAAVDMPENQFFGA